MIKKIGNVFFTKFWHDSWLDGRRIIDLLGGMFSKIMVERVGHVNRLEDGT